MQENEKTPIIRSSEELSEPEKFIRMEKRSNEQKDKIVQQWKESNLGCASYAKLHNIPVASLSCWIRKKYGTACLEGSTRKSYSKRKVKTKLFEKLALKETVKEEQQSFKLLETNNNHEFIEIIINNKIQMRIPVNVHPSLIISLTKGLIT